MNRRQEIKSEGWSDPTVPMKTMVEIGYLRHVIEAAFGEALSWQTETETRRTERLSAPLGVAQRMPVSRMQAGRVREAAE